MSISKFNKTRKFTYELTGEPNYADLRELFKIMGSEGVAKLLMFYKNTKGMYGLQYVAVISYDGVVYNANLPKHLNATMEEMYNDDETVNQINAGKAGLKIYTYHCENYNKDCYSVEFVDVEPTEEFLECDKDALPFE